MASPEIKIISVSNVFCRLMHFLTVGDVEHGHQHTYDHATLVSSGSIMVDVLDNNNEVVSSKVFNAPNMVFIHKDKRHRLTALENNTVCSCIHAIRDVEGEILSPNFLIDPLVSTDKCELTNLVEKKHGTPMQGFAIR